MKSSNRHDTKEALWLWRRQKAKRLGVSAYLVLTNGTITEIVKRRPGTKDELASIAGIGPKKLRAFSREILGVVKTSG